MKVSAGVPAVEVAPVRPADPEVPVELLPELPEAIELPDAIELPEAIELLSNGEFKPETPVPSCAAAV